MTVEKLPNDFLFEISGMYYMEQASHFEVSDRTRTPEDKSKIVEVYKKDTHELIILYQKYLSFKNRFMYDDEEWPNIL